MSRLYTGNHEIVSLNNAYHGASPYTMGLTAHSTWRHPVAGLNGGIHHAMNPDPYCGVWGGKYCRDSPVQTTRNCDCSVGKCEASGKYIQQLEEIFKYSLPVGKCAAMFTESIQGCLFIIFIKIFSESFHHYFFFLLCFRRGWNRAIPKRIH
jgi:alanine-glyoxylate transaminase/(R)-3-amino-2-methylpropionate-pyruvate transaminase